MTEGEGEGIRGDWIPAFAGMTEGVGDARPFDRLRVSGLLYVSG